MDAHRVQVFHVADGDGGVVFIPHHLVFNLLVALDALFHQHLADRGELQGVFHNLPQLLRLVGEASAGAPQGEGGAQHHWVADFFGRGLRLLDGGGYLGGADRLPNLLAQLFKELPVLRPFDAGGGGAQQLHLALPQHPLLFQLHGKVQAGLAPDAGDDGVRALVADDFRHVLQGEGLHIDAVGDGPVGHDGGGVGVCQHHLVSLLPEGQAGLGAGVVELRRLADDDGAAADDHDFMDVSSFGHRGTSFPSSPPPSGQ